MKWPKAPDWFLELILYQLYLLGIGYCPIIGLHYELTSIPWLGKNFIIYDSHKFPEGISLPYFRIGQEIWKNKSRKNWYVLLLHIIQQPIDQPVQGFLTQHFYSSIVMSIPGHLNHRGLFLSHCMPRYDPTEKNVRKRRK